MAAETNYYKYPKPEEEDFYNIAQYNHTLEMIDEDMEESRQEIQKKLDKEKVLGTMEEINDTQEMGFLPDATVIKDLSAASSGHISNKLNPHGVTKSQVGLPNVDNTADSGKSVKYAASAGTAETAMECTGIAAIAAKILGFGGGFENKEYPSQNYYLGFNGGNNKIGCVPAGSLNVGSAIKDGSGNNIGNTYLKCTNGIMRGNLNMNTSSIFGATRYIGQSNTIISAQNDTYQVYLTGQSVQVTDFSFQKNMPIYALSFNVTSSELAKKNIENMEDEEAKKLLNLRVVTFDYKENFGGQTGQSGLIAEEAETEIPSIVTVPDNYSAKEFDKQKGIGNKLLGIDYSKAVPYLIKMAQIQQKQINNMKHEIAELKKMK